MKTEPIKHANKQTAAEGRIAVEVRGVVQGVGFRPFIYALARRLNISGSVRNASDVVRIEAQAPPLALETFLQAIADEAPPQAEITSIDTREIPCLDSKNGVFRILPSRGEALRRPTIPADLATCRQCLAEIRDSRQRRYHYAFTNCTNCGPRWSIINGLPYDRPLSAMAKFDMCDDCRREYESPSDRRFHAQPIACKACGPQLQLLDSHGLMLEHVDSQQALAAAAEMILAGRIVAIKGLGGFQLVVDATNAEAVARLRTRKRRPHKPLAVMVSTSDEAAQHCELSDAERRLLQSVATPIVLLRKKILGTQKGTATHESAAKSLSQDDKNPQPPDLTEAVAPENPYLGVMLPCTPLHHLLIEAVGRPVVCTSGNLSEEPMAVTVAEAVERLGGIADALLVHDRDIVRPVDDSLAVVDDQNEVQILRRARGYAPLPIEIHVPQEKKTDDVAHDRDARAPVVLAVGGHLKNSVALQLGRQVVVGSHVGDLDNLASVEVHRRAVDDLLSFFQVEPERIACDLHPDYASTRLAEELASRWDVPVLRIQHHHAHLAACVAEHGLEGPVLGLAWDGTGYGLDKTIWGGEAFLFSPAEIEMYNADTLFTRVAHLRTFPLPGGDRAARSPRRSALGLLFEMNENEAVRCGRRWFGPSRLNPLMAILDRAVNCPRTSSMGRLFDAVAALCGLPIDADGKTLVDISFEGQAAMSLQFAAQRESDASVNNTDAYEIPLTAGRPAVANWEPLLRGVVDDLAAGACVGIIAVKFHNALAGLAVSIAERVGCEQVVLSGGCFQNGLLAVLVRRRLKQAGFKVYTHQQVPPGDGGICLGQAFIASLCRSALRATAATRRERTVDESPQTREA